MFWFLKLMKPEHVNLFSFNTTTKQYKSISDIQPIQQSLIFPFKVVIYKINKGCGIG